MNTFWLKVALVIVLIIAVIVAISYFSGPKQGQQEQAAAPPPPEKTLGDQFREDEKRLRAEPNITPKAGEPAKQIQFRQLNEEEKAGAEQLFEYALKFREMGRMPGMSYGRMVDTCRDIIQKYPGSEFDYKARRMLADIPERERERFHITSEELNFPQ